MNDFSQIRYSIMLLVPFIFTSHCYANFDINKFSWNMVRQGGSEFEYINNMTGFDIRNQFKTINSENSTYRTSKQKHVFGLGIYNGRAYAVAQHSIPSLGAPTKPRIIYDIEPVWKDFFRSDNFGIFFDNLDYEELFIKAIVSDPNFNRKLGLIGNLETSRLGKQPVHLYQTNLNTRPYVRWIDPLYSKEFSNMLSDAKAQTRHFKENFSLLTSIEIKGRWRGMIDDSIKFVGQPARKRNRTFELNINDTSSKKRAGEVILSSKFGATRYRKAYANFCGLEVNFLKNRNGIEYFFETGSSVKAGSSNCHQIKYIYLKIIDKNTIRAYWSERKLDNIALTGIDTYRKDTTLLLTRISSPEITEANR